MGLAFKRPVKALKILPGSAVPRSMGNFKLAPAGDVIAKAAATRPREVEKAT